MTSRCFLAAVGFTAIFVIAEGCGSYSSKPNDGPGLTEAELKKSMEPDPNLPTRPIVMELTAEETMKLLTDPATAEAVSDSLKRLRRRVIGKVLELSPDNSESLFLVLDGGTHNDRVHKVKCNLAADQREAMRQVKAGDEVRLEGTSDGVLKDVTLEFKNCVFESSANTSAASSPAGP